MKMKSLVRIVSLTLCLSLSLSGLAQDSLPKLNSQTLPPEETYSQVKILVGKQGKTKEVAVRLRFTEDSLLIENPKTGEELKQVPYDTVKEMTYSFSQQPRAGAAKAAGGAVAVTMLGVAVGSGLLVLGGFLAGPIALAAYKHKGKAHWLTVQCEKDYAVLHLNGNNFRVINAALAARTGVKVAVEDNGE